MKDDNMSGYCPDCGNTMCLCDEETRESFPFRVEKIKELEAALNLAERNYKALENERERSKKLIEAIEYHVAYSAPSFTKSQLEDALKEYRGEK